MLNAFISDGIQGVESQMALKNYIETKLDSAVELLMYDIDADAMLEMYVECFGARTAFFRMNRALGWISPSVYGEEVEKYEERLKKAEEGKDRILSDYTYAAQKAEDAEEKIIELQVELIRCKADLYDFYAQAGKIPKYDHERRQ